MGAVVSLLARKGSQAHFGKFLWGGTLLVNLLVIGILGFTVEQNQQRARSTAVLLTENYSRILEETLGGIFEKVDTTLATAVDELVKLSARERVDTHELDAYFKRQLQHNRSLAHLRFADTDGTIRYLDASGQPQAVSVADRPIFRQLRDQPAAHSLISEPMEGAIIREWVIVVGRRLDKPDGSFGGVVFAVLPISRLIEMLSKLDLGAKGNSGLWSKTTLIARFSKDDPAGARTGATTPSPQLRGLLESGKTSATYHARSGIDGIERQYHFRQVRDYPLYLVVGLADTEYLAVWRKDSLQLAGLGLLFVACTIAFATLVHSAWRRREQARSALAEEEAKFRSVFDNAYVGILQLQNRVIVRCNQRIAEMFGFDSPAQLEGRRTEVFYCSHEQFEAAGRVGYSQLADGGFASFEIEMCRQDGSHIWVIQNGSPLDPDNPLNGMSIWVYTDITDRKRVDLELRQTRQMFSTAFESSPVAASIASTDDGRFIEVNANYARDFGWTKEDMIGRTSIELGLWPDLATRDNWVAELRRTGRLVDYETFWLDKYGQRRHISLSSSIIDLDGRSCVLAFATDITSRKSAEGDLRVAAAAFESLQGMMITDAESTILRVNQAFTSITGYPPEAVVGKKPRLLKSGRHDAAFFEGMWRSIAETGGWQGEIWDRRRNAETFPAWLTISCVRDETGKITNYIGTYYDLTERKTAEERIAELAFFDQLTGLPNRTLLQDRLRQTLAASSRSGMYGAVLFIDLDNFKTLNDTLGHDYGDLLLKTVASRLSASVREEDTVSRLGGDEFMLVISGMSADAAEAANRVETVAQKAQAAINQPFDLGDVTRHVTASIGVTMFRGDATTIDELMKQADLAMYKSKEAGRNLIRFFDPALETAVRERVAWEDDLRHALAEGQFFLHYQPQIADERRLVGAEALVRWNHPVRGMVSPAEFIPIAEEAGLIRDLGYWVLETACRQMATWSAGAATAGLTLSVNVSPRQFRDSDFVERVLAALDATGADPRRLKLELTESLLADNLQDIIDKMSALKARGVGFSLDDFGTGYSSLAYLKQLPLDQLKIDRSFVRDVLIDPNDASIAQTIIALGRTLGLDVMAEGVETEAQLTFLDRSGCHAYQGYLFSRPLPPEEFESFALQAAR